MNQMLGFVMVLISFLTILAIAALRRVLVYEYERGLFFTRGKYKKELAPGVHWYFKFIHQIQKVDIRTRSVTIPGQEVLSADNVGVRVSLAVKYQVEDPHQAIIGVEDYFQAMYLELQVALRDAIGKVPIDEFLTKRQELGDTLIAQTQEKVSEYGIALESVALKDIMFPGNLKNIFAQVVDARLEGLAALERARGESAALRKLANTAKLLEKKPGLLQLRMLQTVENNPGNTIILGDISGKGLLTKQISEKTQNRGKK